MCDVFPGSDRIYSEFRLLPRNELAVISEAVLDTALAELLSRRFSAPESEIRSFRGASGDGRAPCGSFGARIQLARLTNVITPSDSIVLRTIKNIRNQFAHEGRADFNSASVLPHMIKLLDQFLIRSNELIEAGHLKGDPHLLTTIRRFLPTTPEAGAALLLAVFVCYQTYFHRLYKELQPMRLFG